MHILVPKVWRKIAEMGYDHIRREGNCRYIDTQVRYISALVSEMKRTYMPKQRHKQSAEFAHGNLRLRMVNGEATARPNQLEQKDSKITLFSIALRN